MTSLWNCQQNVKIFLPENCYSLNNEEKLFYHNGQSEDNDTVEGGDSKKRHWRAYWLSCEEYSASHFGQPQPPGVKHSDQEKGFWKAQKDIQIH